MHDLHQLPNYQKNIVDFVKNGGGLFFLGGEKSLTREDISLSPLAEILPFKFKDLDLN